MDQVFGVGRPLRTITRQVLGAVYREMEEMGMSEEIIYQHADNFAALMRWAEDWGFIRWGGPTERVT